MKFLRLLGFTAFLTIISCQSEPIKIKIVGMKNSISDTVIFDSKDTIVTNGVLDSIFLAPYKNHTFTINKSQPVEFRVNNKEGILNIYNNEFIVYNIDYKKDGHEGDKYGLTEIPLSHFVLIDSFLVFEKKFENELNDIKKYNAVIDTIITKKNGNYKAVFDERQRLIEGDYDTSKMVIGFKKIGRDNIFIEKFWDYDINEKIPEEIQVRINSDSKDYNQKRTQNAIVLASDFLRNAKIWKSEFTVIDVRKDLKKRKK
jgi:hypothetical protein